MMPLVWTSKESWLETEFALGEEPKFDKQTDMKGPLAIGALISTSNSPSSNEPGGTRLAVIGDSDFAANPNFANVSNGDLFVKVLGWLTEGQDIISLDRKILPTRRLILESGRHHGLIDISSIGLLPLTPVRVCWLLLVAEKVE